MADDAGAPIRPGTAVRFAAADGFMLGGFAWTAPSPSSSGRPLVVIAAATSVRCRYYARFASYLADHGFDVLTFDYRGIGESRPTGLRGFEAGWIDWGEKDLEGALRFAAAREPGQDIFVIGHSIGGCLVGAAPSGHRIGRILTVGAQFAYWRDYAPSQRLRMIGKWHVAMPLLASLFGYLPAKRLGWMEDTPKGVARDWSRMGRRFEQTVCRTGTRECGPKGVEPDLLRKRFAAVTAPLLAISLSDDPYGTIPAIERLLAYFAGSDTQHLHLTPADIGASDIGHFAFFHDRFRETLWPVALAWLRDGAVPPQLQRALLPRPPTQDRP